MALASASSSAVSCRHSLLSCNSKGQFLTNLAFFQPTVYKSLAGSNKIYYVAKDEANPAFWLATRVGKMGTFCPLEISRVGPARKISLFVFFCHPLLSKLVRSRWSDFSVFLNKLCQRGNVSERTRCLSTQVHVSELRVSVSSASHIIAHSILIGSRKLRSYVTCRLV